MAKTIEVIIKVNDAAASKKLKNTENQIRNINKATKDAGKGMVGFTRELFATAAVIGIFTKGLSTLYGTIEDGVKADRITEQFESIYGDKGLFFRLLSKSTAHTINEFDAMEGATALARRGISVNINDIADIYGKAGTAAIMMGKNASDGIKEITEFLSDASATHLENLGLLARSDVMFQVQLATLKKVGGAYGDVLGTIQKLALARKLLDEKVPESARKQRDLLDSLQLLSFSYSYLRKEIGTLLGKALQPLIDNISFTIASIRDYLEHIRKTDQQTLKLVKSFILFSVVLGTVLVSAKALFFVFRNFISVNSPIFILSSLVALLVANSEKLGFSFDKLKEKIKPFFEVVRGAWQLISSFFEGDNFSKGIGKIDKSLADFLRKNGLLELAINLAKVGVIIGSFIRDVGKKLVDWFNLADKGLHKLLSTLDKWFGLSSSHNLIPRSWIESTGLLRKILVDLAAAGALYGIGKALFGGLRGAAPRGTKSDPIYVRSSDGSGFSPLFGGGPGGPTGPLSKGGILSNIISKAAGPMLAIATGLAAAQAVKYVGGGGLEDDITSLWKNKQNGPISTSIPLPYGGPQFDPAFIGKTSIPQASSFEERLDQLKIESKNLNEQQQAQFTDQLSESIMNAAKTGNEGISENEYSRLFLLEKYLEQIAKNTNPNNKTMNTSSREN
jgi:hypothetical protein